VLYNVNKKTHWIPGTLTTTKSNKIPKNIVHIQEMPTLASLNSNIKFKETRNDDKNTINSINKIQIVPTHYTKINKELTEPSNTHTQRSPVGESIEKTNNRKVEETNIPKIERINYINSNTKQYLTDSEGTPFSISPKLSITQHNQVIRLLTEYNHIFTTDTSNIKAANINPARSK